MFKSEEQVTTFVNSLEKFVGNIINYKINGDFAPLNRSREELEAIIETIFDVSIASNTVPEAMLCPDCNSEMALRTNRQNGNKFWGCKKYPNCKGTRDENGLSRQDREEAKYKQEQVAQEGGFSFNKEKRNPVTEVSPPDASGWVNPFAK